MAIGLRLFARTAGKRSRRSDDQAGTPGGWLLVGDRRAVRRGHPRLAAARHGVLIGAAHVRARAAGGPAARTAGHLVGEAAHEDGARAAHSAAGNARLVHAFEVRKTDGARARTSVVQAIRPEALPPRLRDGGRGAGARRRTSKRHDCESCSAKQAKTTSGSIHVAQA